MPVAITEASPQTPERPSRNGIAALRPNGSRSSRKRPRSSDVEDRRELSSPSKKVRSGGRSGKRTKRKEPLPVSRRHGSRWDPVMESNAGAQNPRSRKDSSQLTFPHHSDIKEGRFAMGPRHSLSSSPSPDPSSLMMDFGPDAEPSPSPNHPVNRPAMPETFGQREASAGDGLCLHYVHPKGPSNPFGRAECFRLVHNMYARANDLSYWVALADAVYDNWWLVGHVISQHRKFLELVQREKTHPRHKMYEKSGVFIHAGNTSIISGVNPSRIRRPPMCQVTCDLYSVHLVVFARVRRGLGQSTTKCSKPGPDTLEVVGEWGTRAARYVFLLYDEDDRQWWHAVSESSPLTYKLPGWKRTDINEPPPELVPKPAVPSTTEDDAFKEWEIYDGPTLRPEPAPSYPSSVISAL